MHTCFHAAPDIKKQLASDPHVCLQLSIRLVPPITPSCCEAQQRDRSALMLQSLITNWSDCFGHCITKCKTNDAARHRAQTQNRRTHAPREEGIGLCAELLEKSMHVHRQLRSPGPCYYSGRTLSSCVMAGAPHHCSGGGANNEHTDELQGQGRRTSQPALSCTFFEQLSTLGGRPQGGD